MNHSVFLQDVYSVVAAIPTGCVVTYGQIAYLVRSEEHTSELQSRE